MDSLSQAVLGAAVAVVSSGKKVSWKVALLGAVMGTVPDLDVLMRFDDPIDRLVFHRSFSHSLFVLIPLSVLFSWVLHKKIFKDLTNINLWLIVVASLVTHPLLDCFTSYGTGLFWPFFDSAALGSIFIIDPCYTLPLIIALCLSYRFYDKIALFCTVALLISSMYLVWSVVAQQMIENKMKHVFHHKAMKFQSLLVSPTPFNTIFWRVLIKMSDSVYYEGFFPIYRVFNEDAVVLEKIESYAFPSSVEALPLQKLRRFTSGYLYYEIEGDNIFVSDMRLGMYGYYPFRFHIAKKVHGHVEVLKTPVRFNKQVINYNDLKKFMNMIVAL